MVNFEDDIFNNDFGKAVKNTFKRNFNLINSLIGIVSNFKNESDARYFDSNEFTGRIKIAYRPQDIVTYDERIKNLDYERFYDEKKYEFIPGFQYIDKNRLNDFKKLLKEGKVELKTANVITKMATYMEVMLNRVLDIIFLTIKKYLYDKLTDEDMINHLKNEIHLLSLEESKNLMEISPEITQKRAKYTDNLKIFKQAKAMIYKLKDNKYVNINEEEFNI